MSFAKCYNFDMTVRPCRCSHAPRIRLEKVIASAQNVGELETAVVAACTSAGLQPVPPFVLKVVQLYETFNVRFGVMLVGLTGGCWQPINLPTNVQPAGGCAAVPWC